MTQATATAVVHDLIGVGFGPSNIALAIALPGTGPGAGRPGSAVPGQAGRLPLARQHPGVAERVADLLPQGPGVPAQPHQPVFLRQLPAQARSPGRLHQPGHLLSLPDGVQRLPALGRQPLPGAEPLRRRGPAHRADAERRPGRGAAGDLAQRRRRGTGAHHPRPGGQSRRHPRIRRCSVRSRATAGCSTTASTWSTWPSSPAAAASR